MWMVKSIRNTWPITFYTNKRQFPPQAKYLAWNLAMACIISSIEITWSCLPGMKHHWQLGNTMCFQSFIHSNHKTCWWQTMDRVLLARQKSLSKFQLIFSHPKTLIYFFWFLPENICCYALFGRSLWFTSNEHTLNVYFCWAILKIVILFWMPLISWAMVSGSNYMYNTTPISKENDKTVLI